MPLLLAALSLLLATLLWWLLSLPRPWPWLRFLLADARFLSRAGRVRSTLGRLIEGGSGSLPQLFQARAREHPDRVFLRVRDRTWSYRELERLSNRAGRALRGESGPPAGVGPGDTVALLLGNEPRFLAAWFGLAQLGALVAFLNTNVRRGALKHCLGACRARGVVTSPDLFEAILEILPELREMGVTVWVMGAGDYPPDVINLQDLMDKVSDEPLPPEMGRPKSPMEPAICIFTSGTTGLPKAAPISHLKTLMCTVLYLLLGATSDDIIYLSLPLYHKSGSLLGIGGCLGIGASVVLKGKFSASQFWSDCRQHKVTILQYIGELCRYLVNQPKCEDEARHSVRIAVGSGLRPDVWKEITRRFGNIHIVETYGMTEFNVAFFNYTGTLGAVGRGSFLYKKFCKFDLIQYDTQQGEAVRDSRGRCKRVSAGQTGLLISPVTPLSPFLGYVGNKEQTEKKLLKDVFKVGDCYFNTGDLMMQDRLGHVYFRDRTGDTFRWKGENVATTEVSEILSALEIFQEVNVYGVTIPGHEGRAGMAALILRPDHELELDRVYTHVMEFIPTYARPRFLRVMEHMEATGTFKQQKQSLVQQGFCPSQISDPLFVLDEGSKSYRPLTEEVHSRIVSGDFRV
ncbi:long-chain fatty acid transport protein 3 [Discoglossus pictus]